MLFYPSLLITLAASAAAIDVRMRKGSTNCDWSGGGWVFCNNVSPGLCCVPSEPMQTIWVAAIPDGWNVDAEVWLDAGCTNRAPTLHNGGQNGPNACERAGGNVVRGGGYSFRNAKRDADATASSGCQQADRFMLGDGTTQYNISGLSSAALNELFDLSDNFTAPADMPQHIKALQLN